MKCGKVQELFSSYLENAIEPPMRVAVEQHFAECPSCKAEYERFHATAMLLDEMPEVEPPPGFHAAVMASVERARRAAPVSVKWWHIDFQRAFNARVPVRAVAMGLAVLLVLAVIVQLTPIGAITANILGLSRGKHTPVNVQDDAPQGPLPWGAKQHVNVNFDRAGTGISISLAVDSANGQYDVFTFRFRSETGAAVPVETYLLPDGVMSANPETAGVVTKISSASVAGSEESVVPIATTHSRPLVAEAVWQYEGRNYSEYVFVPAAFDRDAVNKSLSLSYGESTVREVLSSISNSFGVVILVDGSIAERTAAANMQDASPESALAQMLTGTSLRARALTASVYAVEPRR